MRRYKVRRKKKKKNPIVLKEELRARKWFLSFEPQELRAGRQRILRLERFHIRFRMCPDFWCVCKGCGLIPSTTQQHKSTQFDAPHVLSWTSCGDVSKKKKKKKREKVSYFVCLLETPYVLKINSRRLCNRTSFLLHRLGAIFPLCYQQQIRKQ